MNVDLTVNGESRTTKDVEPRKTLADFLREDCALTGTHLLRTGEVETNLATGT